MRLDTARRLSLALPAFLIFLLIPRPCLAAVPIVVDGQFGDWAGKAHLEDGSDDVKHHWDDVRYWYWATNDGVSNLYFMVERFGHHGQKYPEEEMQAIEVQGPAVAAIGEAYRKDKKQVHYTIFIDADNNFGFDDPTDSVVLISYFPDYQGLAYVMVFRGGWLIRAYGGLWGEDGSVGGLRVEFAVAFQDLGIGPGQVLNLVLFAQDKRTDWLRPDPIEAYESLVQRREADRVPDDGELQWAPVPSLGALGWVPLLAVGVGTAWVAVEKSREKRTFREP